MRNPNGFGNVSKLPGKRRNPWRARVTSGWIVDPETGKTKQQYINIGYYPTRADALNALGEYNKNPYSIADDATFADIYDRWSAEKFPTVSESNVKGYRASFAVCGTLYKMQFGEIRKSHLQGVVDNCGKNYPTLRKLKVLFNQLYRFAIENDICEKDYSEFVDIAKHKVTDDSDKHKPFTDAEVERLWAEAYRSEQIEVVLMLIYSGVRISELLDLKIENVHLSERYFDVIASKTDSGVRKVPISAKTLPFFEKRVNTGGNYLIKSVTGKAHIDYHGYMRTIWEPLMRELAFDHLPHDTRHTTISMLAKAEVPPMIIKKIVGHKGAMDLTERVYTHTDISQLVAAIDKI